MRKSTWGALLLGVFALTFGSPIRESRALHGIVSLAGLAGYVLLSMSPVTANRTSRRFLVAGALAGLASFLLVISFSQSGNVPPAVGLVARVLAVATVALPLWPLAGPSRYLFGAAAAIAAMTVLPSVEGQGRWATSLHAYVALAAAFWAAWILEGAPKPGVKRTKRVVVASNMSRMSPEERLRRRSRIESRYRAGELDEHTYLDQLQELDSL